jgi:dephospho-CoA kinase
MIKIAITGGIGSGKSTICKIVESLSFPVYYSDSRAKDLINSSPTIIKKLKELFGNDIYINKQINKSKLASIIFSSKNYLEKVNSIIHPEVEIDFHKWASAQKSSMVFKESAIIFESKQEKDFDYIICVSADIHTRIERVKKRDNSSSKDIMQRISKQLPQEHIASLSDFVIDNSGKKSLLSQIDGILSSIKEK